MKEKKILLNKLLKQSDTNFLDCSSYKEAIAILKNGIKAKYFLINGNPLTISIMINNTKQSFIDENVIFLSNWISGCSCQDWYSQIARHTVDDVRSSCHTK